MKKSGKKIFKSKKSIAIFAAITVVVVCLIVFLSVYFSLFYYGQTVDYDNDQREILKLRTASVDFAKTVAELKREISPEAPLNLVTYYDDAAGIEALWSAMPDFMQEISVLLLIPGNILKPANGQAIGNLERNADECERLQIPFAIQSVNGETHAEWLIPLKYLENRFLNMKYCYGLSAAELYNAPVWRGALDGDFSEYIADSIRIAAKYGAFMFWTDTNIFGTNGNIVDWIENSETLYSAMKENYGSVIMQNKESYGDASSYSIMYGLYLSKLIGGWGVATDFWHWQVSHYRSVFGAYNNLVGGEWERIFNYPEAMEAASLLFVASAGGFCFKNEAQFYSTAANGVRTAGYQYAILPFFERILTGKLVIPSREQLLNSAQFAVVGGKNYEPINYDLSQSTLYPDTGAYGIVPLLPANLRVAERKIFDDHRIALVEERMTDASLRPYAQDVEGNTFCSFTAGTWYYVNNSENKNLSKYARFALTSAPEIVLNLTSEPHFSAVVTESDGRLDFYMNNYRTDVKELNATLKGEPERPEDVIEEWFGLNENGDPNRVKDQEKRTSVLEIDFPNNAPEPKVAFDADNEFVRPYTYRKNYDPATGKLTLWIEQNGSVSFSVAVPQASAYTAKEKSVVNNRKSEIYSAVDESHGRAALDDAQGVLNDRANYQECSFRIFRNYAEKLKVGLDDKTLDAEGIRSAVERLNEAKTQLINVADAVDAIKNFDTGAAVAARGKAFDALQRALYAPTEYVKGKENKLKLKIPYRRDRYDAKLMKLKTKEIEKALDKFKIA